MSGWTIGGYNDCDNVKTDDIDYEDARKLRHELLDKINGNDQTEKKNDNVEKSESFFDTDLFPGSTNIKILIKNIENVHITINNK
jgi:predicted glycosyltransferase